MHTILNHTHWNITRRTRTRTQCVVSLVALVSVIHLQSKHDIILSYFFSFSLCFDSMNRDVKIFLIFYFPSFDMC